MTMLSGHNRAASITDKLKISGIAPPPAAPATPAGQAAAPTPAAPVQQAPAQPSGQLGLFGEPTASPKSKGAAANPLANITVQSSTPPARQ
jgi:hypothetical protein